HLPARTPDGTYRYSRLPHLLSFPETVAASFFQAEDGIRDRTVTGVQTCALPILWPTSSSSIRGSKSPFGGSNMLCRSWASAPIRSEERRVGKACRSRSTPCH